MFSNVLSLSAALKPVVDLEFWKVANRLLSEFVEGCPMPTGLVSFSDYSDPYYQKIASIETGSIETVFSFDLIRSCVENFLALHISNPGINSAETERSTEYHQSTSSLLSYIQMNLFAIKVCSLEISDLPARILCRSVSEAADLLIAVQGDDGLAREWIDSQLDPRAFWHKNLSGKRLSQRRNRILNEIFHDRKAELGAISDHMKNESTAFSMASHPSYQAGIMAIMEVVGDDGWHSRRTMQHTAFRVAIALQAATAFCSRRKIRFDGSYDLDPDKLRTSLVLLLRAATFCSLSSVPDSDYKSIGSHISAIQ